MAAITLRDIEAAVRRQRDAARIAQAHPGGLTLARFLRAAAADGVNGAAGVGAANAFVGLGAADSAIGRRRQTARAEHFDEAPARFARAGRSARDVESRFEGRAAVAELVLGTASCDRANGEVADLGAGGSTLTVAHVERLAHGIIR